MLARQISSNRRRIAAVLAAAAAAAGAAADAPAAVPRDRVDEFSGTCRFEGVRTAQSDLRTIDAQGTCSGVLNGVPIVNAPLRVKGRAVYTTLQGITLLADGDGVATLTPRARRGRAASIGFTFEQVGVALHMLGDAGGDAVLALAITGAPAETTPFAGVMRTLTPVRG